MREGSSKKVKNDVILICALLVIALIAGAALLLFRAEGDTVSVKIDGETVYEFPLSVDRTLEIEAGEGYNLLIIEDGKARVESASCPDGICSSHRPISRDGESIICLPNKVVIEVHAKSGDEPDIII